METPITPRDRRFRTLVIISAVFCLFHLLLLARAPAYDGDSFEYAGIARNLYAHGTLREDLIRSYSVKDQPLPHPPGQRAGLYSFILVPFYAVFRNSQWTFIFPAFIGLFFLPLAVYRAGGKLFDPDIGFYSAILALFSLSLLRLYTFLDPGLPEVWQIILYVYFAYALIKERYALAGLLMALAFLIRNNSVVLIPAAVPWMFAYRRRALFGWPAVKLFGVALLPVIPFMVRSMIVFHTPFYTEQFAGISSLYGGGMLGKLARGDYLGIMFNYDAYNAVRAPAHLSVAVRAGYFLRAFLITLKLAAFGGKTGVFYLPGILQTAGLVLIPFFILGVRTLRKRPEAMLILLIAGIQIILHTVSGMYQDRYIMCVLPFIFFTAIAGLKSFQNWASSKYSYFAGKPLVLGIVLFVLMSDSLSFLVMNPMRFFQAPQDNVMTELQTTCDYIRLHSAPDTVIMTYPFSSTHFVCGRMTTPLPYGRIRTMAAIIKKYNVRYLIYTKTWPEDLFPELPFAPAVARGLKVSLFKIDPGLVNLYISNPDAYPADAVNPVGYFLSGRISFELGPPIYKVFAYFTKSIFLGAILYIISALVFILAFLQKGFLKRTLPIILIAVMFAALDGYQFFKFYNPYMAARPQISRIETKYTAGRMPDINRVRLKVIGFPSTAPLLEKDLKPFFKNINVKTITDPAPYYLRINKKTNKEPAPEPPGEGETLFITVPPLATWLSDQLAFAKNADLQRSRSETVENIVLNYRDMGFKTAVVYGGVFVYK